MTPELLIAALKQATPQQLLEIQQLLGIQTLYLPPAPPLPSYPPDVDLFRPMCAAKLVADGADQ